MTFVAVRCPHCQSDQIVNRGKSARGTQRYLCQNTLCANGSFLLDYSPIFALRNRLTFLIVNLIVFKECGRFM